MTTPLFTSTFVTGESVPTSGRRISTFPLSTFPMERPSYSPLTMVFFSSGDGVAAEADDSVFTLHAEVASAARTIMNSFESRHIERSTGW